MLHHKPDQSSKCDVALHHKPPQSPNCVEQQIPGRHYYMMEFLGTHSVKIRI